MHHRAAVLSLSVGLLKKVERYNDNASFNMPKAKVHSGAAKRFKQTGAGYKRKSANKSHILTKMTTKRKRQLRGTSIIDAADKPLIDKMMRNN